jgi:alpha-tubulin suppressor-like RCC1 family protein
MTRHSYRTRAGLTVLLALLSAYAGEARAQARLASAERFVQVSVGGDHTCGITDDGRAFCWGEDFHGRLGNGHWITEDQAVPSPVVMPEGVRFTRISAGGPQSCAVAADGRAFCWGMDLGGELGNGPTDGVQHVPSEVSMPPGTIVTDISAGPGYTCAVAASGKGYCWGRDRDGQLGNGSRWIDDQHAPSEVSMPQGVGVASISTGIATACAVGTNGRAYCWGLDGDVGLLGDGRGRSGDPSAPVEVHLPVGVTVTAVAVGGMHACALARGGRMYCWGNDDEGQLGNGPVVDSIHRAPGPAYVPEGVAFTAITAASGYTCAVGTNGRAYCWGGDGYGRLGNGPPGSQTAAKEVSLPPGVRVTGIDAGYFHACVSSAGGQAYCWGRDSNGRLGNGGSNANAPAPTPVAPATPPSRPGVIRRTRP